MVRMLPPSSLHLLTTIYNMSSSGVVGWVEGCEQVSISINQSIKLGTRRYKVGSVHIWSQLREDLKYLLCRKFQISIPKWRKSSCLQFMKLYEPLTET